MENHVRITRVSAGLAIASALAMTLAACSSGSSTTSSASAAAPASSAAASGSAAAGEDLSGLVPQPLKDKGYISVAADIPYAPMEFEDADGNLTGLDYDLAQAVGQKLGIELRFEKQAWDSIIPSLQSGRHDVIWSSMNDTEERQQTLDFVDYYKAGFAILVAKGNPEGIKTIADLCGKAVAVQTATVQGDLLKAYSKDSCNGNDITIQEFPQDPDALNAIRAGKAVADVSDAAIAAYAAQTAGDGQYFEVVVDPANPNGYESVYTGVGVLKKDTALRDAIQAGVNAIIADGTYQQILDKWNLSSYAIPQALINSK